jgi:hypothetical protein
MKKIIIGILLALSLSSFAMTDNEMNKYVQNKNIALQVLGAGAYYEDNCKGLTAVGDYYRNVVMILHGITEQELRGDAMFQSGYSMASYYGDCDRIAREFQSLGMEDFLERN